MQATPEDVRYAYRLLLGREPDEGGKANFEHFIAQLNMAPDSLADLIMQSAEYRARRQEASELVRNPLEGYSVFCRKGDKLIGSHLVSGLPYEPWVMPHFDAALAGAQVFLDVGANIGIFTMRAASRIPASGRVIAVEPLPQNLRCLYAGIRDNGFRHVQVFPFAASDGPGLVEVACEEDSSNGIVRVAGEDGSASTTVPAHRLDDLLASLDRLDLVKIDIEGHEHIAWRGLARSLARFQPVIFLEFSPLAIRRDALTTPEHFAAQLLAYSPRIRLLKREQEPVWCASVAEIMAEWEAENRQFGLGGEMHVDLLLDPRT